MTLERAVNLLTQDNEETLVCAAGHIQNQCFKSIEAKKMVYYLRGIGKLLQLLHIDNEEVQRVAAGALRNVVYQNSENKMEVKENDGIALILSALKSSRDVETRRQLTGLLWNLSSHDLLKERLSRESLFVLTKYVLVPSSGISEGENPKDELLADDEVFHNATGCLRYTLLC
ncbi:plakophilin-1-like [Cynoglossus semilaevis]|uniref:plakophilin-1-like n=1 Tax=Cynoglossus semilaevis TaxID=244447 RepID=UPI000D62C5AB|nr:plakophilin-1-like [Cynoglossus semilaevis]